MTGRDPFCIICGVSLDLHPSGVQNEDAWECGIAARKVELLGSFGRFATAAPSPSAGSTRTPTP